MTAYNVIVNLEDTSIVGCMQFTQLIDARAAIKQTLEAFVKTMQDRGRIRFFEQREMDEIIQQTGIATLETGDLFEDVQRNFKPVGEYNQDIGEQVEGEISKASTPKIGRTVEIGDTQPGETKNLVKTNMFDQHRMALSALNQISPKDRLIEKAVMISKIPSTLSLDDRIWIAALEITYTMLPRELWGSLGAEQRLNAFVEMHDGSKSEDSHGQPASETSQEDSERKE